MSRTASDGPSWQPHIRTKKAREELAKRFKNADDPLKLVIVRDMWLTGFDAPSLHTMYVDKPMRGHGLMQAIARVNRVFKDKPGGLVVDYLGLAHELKAALATYTESGGTGRTALDQDEAVAKRDIDITLSAEAKDYIAEIGWDPQYGARPLKRAIQRVLEDPLAKHIIEQARYGERDQRRLRDGALLQYALSKLRSKPRK